MSEKPNLFQSGQFTEPLQDNSLLTTDQPAASVEPSVKQQDPVVSVPRAEKLPDAPKNVFKRQLVLMKEIQQYQVECEYAPGHSLMFPNKDTIACYNCGALWIR